MLSWLLHRPPWRSWHHRRARLPEGTHAVRRLHAPSRTIHSVRHGMIGSVSPTLVTLAPSLPMSPVLPSATLVADTSLGVVQRFAPPSSRSRGSPLRGSTGCPASPVGREVPPSRLVPPSWFHTTSAAFSSLAARACCSPLPTLGFTPFQTALPPSSPGCAPALRSVPSPCSDPERVRAWGAVTRSAIAGVPVHLLPCPPAVSVHTGARPCGHPPAPWRYLGSLLPVVTRPTHLRALLHTRLRCRPRGCPRARPVAPMGLGIVLPAPSAAAEAKADLAERDAGTSKTADLRETRRPGGNLFGAELPGSPGVGQP